MLLRGRTPSRCLSAGGVSCTVLLALLILAITGCRDGDSDAVPDGAAGRREDQPSLRRDGTVVQKVTPAPRPTEALPEGIGCINSACHAPLDRLRHVHYAVEEGGCFTCHQQDQGGHTYPLVRTGDDLCTFCHSVTGARAHTHAAVELHGCTGCHQPHGSNTKFLLNAVSIEAQCLQCHVLTRGPNAHGPVAAGECTACHQPHASDHESLLRGGDGPSHCFTCHQETQYVMTQAPFVHEPAAEDCTGCHEPHFTAEPHALRRPIDQLCFECHEDIEQQVAGAAAPHAAVFTGERCANCHDPHGAGHPELLRDRQDVLCLQCHDQPLAGADGRTVQGMGELLRDREFLHGPVRVGNCTACHNVHGASHARLLKERFTDEFYASFDLSNYALCFDCHESGLVTEPRTTTLTDFRDGDLNLHYIHVNRDDKGRTCRTCHEIHGSDLPRHMAETVPFEGSDWAMPIGFELTDNGGSCGPGCHTPRTYERDVAAGREERGGTDDPKPGSREEDEP